MKICRHISTFRAAIDAFRVSGQSVGLVTTMGALHAGHMALVAAAKNDHDRVIATLFVNPTQFGDPSDLETYPRNEDADMQMFRDAGVDLVLIPSVDEMYPSGDETFVETERLAQSYHGAVRPGHFRGVATVVTKLFNIAGADAAYFGEKDYQQLAVIRRMVKDLHIPIRIEGVATVREADGLAMSSRNQRLTPEDRAAAPILNASLLAAEALVQTRATVSEVETLIRETIATEPRGQLVGLDIVWADSFEKATGPVAQTIGIMISVKFGKVLLIDQREITP